MDNTLPGALQFHHVGYLTKNIGRSLDTYVNLLGFRQHSEIITVSSQKVRVCFVETGPGALLELVQPEPENTGLGGLLKTSNPYYHIGYLARNFADTIVQLEEKGFYVLERFRSEAFEDRECAFLYTNEKHLIELIEF